MEMSGKGVKRDAGARLLMSAAGFAELGQELINDSCRWLCALQEPGHMALSTSLLLCYY
jgi:hypothetical protein